VPFSQVQISGATHPPHLQHPRHHWARPGGAMASGLPTTREPTDHGPLTAPIPRATSKGHASL